MFPESSFPMPLLGGFRSPNAGHLVACATDAKKCGDVGSFWHLPGFVLESGGSTTLWLFLFLFWSAAARCRFGIFVLLVLKHLTD